MTSTTIYPEIKPTYLYIKQHSITGLKYFGKTTQDPYKYSGSGTHWKYHYKKHGKEHIKTLWVSDLYCDISIVEVALHFSLENNIVESKEWANLILENGLSGGANTPETIQKAKDTRRRNGTGMANPEIMQKQLDTKKKNGTIYNATPESIQKAKDTRIQNGTMNPMKNPECIQKAKDTKKERGVVNPSLILFLSIIDSKKTYNKGNISRNFPEFKKYY